MNKLISVTVSGLMLLSGLPAVAGAHEEAQVIESLTTYEKTEAIGEIQPASSRAAYDAVKSGAASLEVKTSKSVLPTVNKRTAAEVEATVSARGWENAQQREFVDALIKEAIARDGNVADAEVSPEEVKVKYKRSAKLFGFIPVAYYHAFTADGKGNISNGKPWWLIFAASDASTFAAGVEEDFQKEQSQLRWIKAPTALELATQRFSSISNILKTRHDTVKNSIGNIR